MRSNRPIGRHSGSWPGGGIGLCTGNGRSLRKGARRTRQIGECRCTPCRCTKGDSGLVGQRRKSGTTLVIDARQPNLTRQSSATYVAGVVVSDFVARGLRRTDSTRAVVSDFGESGRSRRSEHFADDCVSDINGKEQMKSAVLQYNSIVWRSNPDSSALGPTKISTSPASNKGCRSGPR